MMPNKRIRAESFVRADRHRMPMKYPLLAIEQRGFVQMIPSSNYWTHLPLAFINLYRRRLGVLKFYDKDGNKWRLESIEPEQSIGLLRRFVGLHLGLSVQPVQVAVDLQLAGPYSMSELQADFRSAVEADDDILCQFHDKQQILKWLDDAKSIPKIFDLYNWITKKSFRNKSTSA
jgi:hypothetical protein